MFFARNADLVKQLERGDGHLPLLWGRDDGTEEAFLELGLLNKLSWREMVKGRRDTWVMADEL